MHRDRLPAALRRLAALAALTALCAVPARAQTLAARFDGDVLNDQAGAAVGGGFDVDGDGVDDVIVGVPYRDVTGINDGVARVYSGASGALIHQLAYAQPYARFGAAVACVGDLNGDGRSELLVGAPLYDTGGTDCGMAYVFSGLTGGVLYAPGGS